MIADIPLIQCFFKDNRWLFILFLVFTFGQSSHGQYKPVVLRSEQGLTQAAVRSIAQDSEGFLWIATWDGLNRYDGHRFVNFSHNPGDANSLSNNNLINVTFDGKDRPWVTAMNGEINLFDRRRNSFSLLRDKNGVPVHSVYNGFPTSFDNEHMVFLSPKGVVLTRISDLSSTILPEVKGFLPGLNKGGTVAIFFSNTDLLVVDKSQKVYRIPLGFEILVASPINAGIVQLLAATGDLYDIYVVSGEVKKKTKITSVNNRSFTGYQIHNDGNGITRVLTSEGAFSIDREGKVTKGLSISKVENQLKSGGLIYSLAEDYIGNLWVGTSLGLIKFEKKPVEFTNYPESGDVETTFESDRITSILQLENSRFLVASTGGIYHFDEKSGQFKKYKNNLTGFEGVLVYSLFKDQKKNLWAGTKKGLLKLQSNGGNLDAAPVRFKESPDNDEWINRITAITEDSEGNLWIGTIRGLIKYSPTLGDYKIFYFHADFGNEGDTYILSLLYDNGFLWVGTNSEGLLRINTSDMSHIRYSTRGKGELKLTGDKIMAIHKDMKGSLWIATMGGGVNVLDKEQKNIKTISISDGLANNTVYGILEDKSGNIWVSTNKGISRINAETLKPANYSRSDGLLSGGYHQYSYLQGLDGKFYFGGSNGITVFNPNEITPNTHKPKVALTDFRIFNNPALDRLVEREIELRYDENFFTFEMTATNFEDPSSNEYHWKLEGLTDEWVNAGNRRTVDISNIPPGGYLFKVKVANRDGIWSDDTLLAKIVVVPPFWKTSWFLVISGIVLIGIIILVTVALFRRKLNREIAELEKEKMIFMERTKTRDRIARDLHDDLASTVSGAGLYIQSATNVMGKNNDVARKMIEKSASLLTEAEQAMRDIVWSVSPQYDNVENLILRVRILTREICEAARIRFEFNKSGETSSMLKDEIRRNLYLSVKEVLMNAVKHSGASQISVAVEVSERNISIKIMDDGTGFRMESQSEKLGGNGLVNIRKRCEEIGAAFEIMSAEGEGTTVIIKANIEK